MRVKLKLESLDGRILPGGSWGTVGGGDFTPLGSNSIRIGQETNLTGGKVGGGMDATLLGSNERGLGSEPSLMGVSKPTGAIGDRLHGDTDGVELFGMAHGHGVEV
jgi:hypothetical protein